jgi:hypothetical protein
MSPFASSDEAAANNSGTDFSVKVMPKGDHQAGGKLRRRVVRRDAGP